MSHLVCHRTKIGRHHAPNLSRVVHVTRSNVAVVIVVVVDVVVVVAVIIHVVVTVVVLLLRQLPQSKTCFPWPRQ